MSRKLQGVFFRQELLAGLALALADFFLLLSVLFLTAWSYSLWGSPQSPVRFLLIPALSLFAFSLLIRLSLRWLLRRLHRIHRVMQKREKIRNSRSQEQVRRR